jgi:hypothetical protein
MAIEGLAAILAHNVTGERNDRSGPLVDENDNFALGFRFGCTFHS